MARFSPCGSVTARRSTITFLFLGLFVTTAARGDELKLKDGTKIEGTIVGFEENSFKVKTSYGFAEVQKDQVVSITISDATKKDSAKKIDTKKNTEIENEKPAASPKPAIAESSSASPSDSPALTPAKKPAAPPTPVAASVSSVSTSPVAKASASTPIPAKTTVTKKPDRLANSESNAAQPNPGAVSVPSPPTSGPSLPASPAASVSAAPVAAKPPAPEPVKEEVSGNAYTNDTYGFRMYKPPDWNLIEGARAILPGSITALGTDDQTTYLLIGQEPAGKSLASDIDSTEQRLREIMENFRPLGEKHLTISGIAAVEHRFRGSVEQRDWSGVVVYIPRDKHVYTIFGMTLADTDLVQIQENVIARAISSLQFTKP